MERPLVIYHANCPDGFGAAVAAYCHFRQGDDCLCDFVAASFGQPPPEVTGRQVYILDFSYARPVLKIMCRTAQRVTILDHHLSAEQDLDGLEREHTNLRVIFDMDKSGSVLTWDFFHHTPPPQLLLLIQDRDLWRFALEGTNDLYAALQARPFDFQAWAALIDGGELPASLFAEGEAINRYRREMIALHRDKAVIGTIDGCQVPIVNCYDEIASDLLGELAEGHPFAVGYQDQGNRRKWSLRSSATGADVAEIATRFGGGGHQHAAGFITQIPDGLLHISSQIRQGVAAAAHAGSSPIAIQNACLYQDLAESKRLESFKQGIIDSLPANIAVLDQQGIIIAVNRSWVLFAEENGLPDASSVCAGVDYLAACRKAADLSDPLALEALLGIEMVLNKEISNFTLNYPCHSPTSQRWFMMQVVRSNEMQGAVVTHLDITDRIKIENKLQDANQELEAFNYTVAHDLRTPLNTLSLSCQAIEMLCGDQVNEECQVYVRNISTSTLQMNELIDALLTFSRMGHVEPQREKIDLCTIAREIVTTLQKSEPERQVDVRISDRIEAHGDACLLWVVLNNLLGNAWKFAARQENAVIEFEVKEIDGMPTYFVRDNGVGFDKENANKLFIPFQRLPGAEISQGFGIGLATVERIIRRHGGRIWAEGERGKGACFYFTLAATGRTE